MNIPTELKIGGHLIAIEIGKAPTNLCGQFDRDTNKIIISETLPSDQRESTLLHEIIHALNGEWGGGTDITHILLDSISEQLYQVLKDNKFNFND